MSTRNVMLVVLATIVIFAAGVVTGGLLVRTSVRAPMPAPPPPMMFPARFDSLRRLTDQLQDLTPDQRARINRIIRDGHERIADFFYLFEPDIQDVFRRMREDIKAELTPDQRRRMEDLLRQRPRRPEGRGPRPERGEGPYPPRGPGEPLRPPP